MSGIQAQSKVAQDALLVQVKAAQDQALVVQAQMKQTQDQLQLAQDQIGLVQGELLTSNAEVKSLQTARMVMIVIIGVLIVLAVVAYVLGLPSFLPGGALDEGAAGGCQSIAKAFPPICGLGQHIDGRELHVDER